MKDKLQCERSRCRFLFEKYFRGQYLCWVCYLKLKQKDYKKENKTYTNEKEVTLSNGIKNAKP